MSTIVYSIVTAPGQSDDFFNFKPKHFSVTNREIEIFNSELVNDFEINLLHRFVDGVETAPKDGLTISVRNGLMDIMDLIITKSNNGTLSIDNSVTTAEFANQFPAYTILFESLITDSNNKVWPQKVTVTVGAEIAVLYLFPSKFELSYPNSNIEVIPLFNNINDFGVINLSAINAAIANLSSLPYAAEFDAITRENPCTNIELAYHQWVNRANLSEDASIPFGLVCYGDPSEEAKDAAVREFIESKSTLSKSDKEVIFPSLFGSYGFTLVPFWNNVAFKDSRNVYSPIVDTRSMIQFVSDGIPTLNYAHVDANWELLPTIFQSLSCFVVPDEIEFDNVGTLTDTISRYFLVATTDADFVDMPNDTQEFVKTLIEALSSAESYPNTNPAVGVEIEIIGDLSYATFFSGGLRWRVLTKISFSDLSN